MGCGCSDRNLTESIRKDPYMGRRAILKNGKEGTIFNRLAGDRSGYLFETPTEERIVIKISDIERLLPE